MLNRILVPLDGSSLAECVLPHVIVIAQAFDAQVTLLRVLERPNDSELMHAIDPIEWQLIKAKAEAYLKDVTIRLEKSGLNVQRILKEGQAAKSIIDFAHRNDINLIVLSSHGQSGLSGWNVSSIVQKIVLLAYTSLLIVRAYQPAHKDLASIGYQKIMVPLDGSQRAENVLPLTMLLSRFYGSQLLLTHMVHKPDMLSRTPLSSVEIKLLNKITERNRKEAKQYLEEIRSRSMEGVNIRLYINEGNSSDLHNVVELEGVNLVVLGAHGYSGNPKWPYGSVALNFIVYGTTSLLIVQDISHDEARKTGAEFIGREEKGH